MPRRGRKFQRKNSFLIAAWSVLILVVINIGLTVYYRGVIIQHNINENEILETSRSLNAILDDFRMADLGIRAYIIEQREDLIRPFYRAKEGYLGHQKDLELSLIKVDMNTEFLRPLFKSMKEYFDLLDQIKYLCENNRSSEAVEIFKQDKGYELWLLYEEVMNKVNAHLNDLQKNADDMFQSYKSNVLFVQIILTLLTIPTLIILIFQLVKDKRRREMLVKVLDESNKKYIFDSDEDYDSKHQDIVIKNIIENLKKAANFVINISKENFDVRWEGMNENNRHLNENNIAGELIIMRDRMKEVKESDSIRLWITDGVNKFSDILRKYNNDLDELTDVLLSELVKYVGANQGGIFLLEKDKEADKVSLVLKSCYAYERKKFVQKRVSVTEGLLGQCFQEKEVLYLENVPEDYVIIGSGLGNSKPRSIIFVPLKNNEDITGVIELASFKKFREQEITLLRRVGELMASAFINVMNNERTKELLLKSQQQAEELIAQEEEMRQNMEELQATHEQMHRKEMEYLDQISRLQEKITELEGSLLE